MEKYLPRVENIINNVKKQNPNLSENQADMIRQAFVFAYQAHDGQKRLSGEDYIIHPLATAELLAKLHFEPITIIAALLHDVPEDTDVTLSEIKKIFGKEIAGIIEGITKLSRVKYRGIERYAENLRKMFVAMAKDIRTIVVKFADRIHNLKTLKYQSPHKATRIAKESMEIYAPIANRLGMAEIKNLLEDLSFPYVLPQEHAWVKSTIIDRIKYMEKVLNKAQAILSQELKENNIEFISVNTRIKGLYSIYLKLLTHDKNIDRIYDLIAIRIIVKSIKDCYAALGIIHTLWTPMKGRIKDYIAQPKPNHYQSLHTTLFNDKGDVIEIQIRTQEMHDYAEYGIAAHWQYSEKRAGTLPQKYKEWINNLVDWQKEISDSAQYLDNLQKVKLDFFQNRIFVFTPNGDVIDLPENATPIDFAYHIHTDVGNQCTGTRINRNMAALDTPLKNGDVVEIDTNASRKWPNPDWLNIVKTNHAKNKIKDSLKKKRGLLNINLKNPFNKSF